MTHKQTLGYFPKLSFLLFVLIALSACGKDKNKNPGDDGLNLAPLGASQNNQALGDPNDPKTPAYFQQKIGDSVYFDVNQSTLNDEARLILDAQAKWLVQQPSVNILIEGHADERGTREYNLALGARRASSVQSYLVSQGLTDQRVRTVTLSLIHI